MPSSHSSLNCVGLSTYPVLKCALAPEKGKINPSSPIHVLYLVTGTRDQAFSLGALQQGALQLQSNHPCNGA